MQNKRLIAISVDDGETLLIDAKEVVLYELDQTGNYHRIETLYTAEDKANETEN